MKKTMPTVITIFMLILVHTGTCWALGTWTELDSPVKGDEYGWVASWSAANNDVFGLVQGPGQPAPAPETDGARVFRYSNGFWTELTLPNGGDYIFPEDIWGSATDDVYLVGRSSDTTKFSGIMHYDGSAWTNVTLPIDPGGILGIWGSGPNDVFAGTSGTSQILHYDGSVWNVQNVAGLPISEIFERLWGSGPNDVYAVGTTGHICHYDGTSWTVVKKYDLIKLRDVWGTAADNVYVIGEYEPDPANPIDPANAGRMYHYDGAAWSEVDLPENANIPVSIWGSSASSIWIATGGTVFFYDGSNFTDTYQNDASLYAPSEISGFSENSVYLLGAWVYKLGQPVTAVTSRKGIQANAAGAVERLEALDPTSQSNQSGRPSEMPYGLFDFDLEVPTGATITCTFELDELLASTHQIWYKYNDSAGFYRINTARFTTSEDGLRTIVTLTLTDGGEGDGDDTANGRITDPSGPGNTGTSGGGGGGGGGCFVLSVN